MAARVVLVLLIALLFAGCAAKQEDDGTGPAPPPSDGKTRFIALGDGGTGGEDQFQVARAIEAVCLLRGCDFAVYLGDVIYPSGASSANDPQFDSKFEVPYANLSFPFYIALGNHDNSDPYNAGPGLGLWYEQGNNEVAYARRTDRASDKWTMPDRHYSFAYPNVTFVVVDTNTLLFGDAPIPPDQDLSVQEQGAFIDGAFADVQTPWAVAAGHHGYLSNGPHGNAGSYDGLPAPGMNGDYLKTFFEDHVCGVADLYIAGHDHNLQWLEPTAACGDTQFIVSGGAGAGLYELGGGNPAIFEQETLGFWWIEVDATSFHGVAFDEAAEPLFEHNLTKAP